MPVSEKPYLQIYGEWNIYECTSCDSRFAIDAERDQSVFVHCPNCKKSTNIVVMGTDFIER